jgi:PIN like domain
MKKVAVDRCLPLRFAGMLTALYGKDGYEFISVKSLGGGPDETWADSFKRFGGEIVLSGDYKIATRPHQALAFIDNGFKCFFPGPEWQKLSILQKISYMSHHWGLLMDEIESVPQGSCWRMEINFRSEHLTLSKPLVLQRLEIPQAVLDQVRAKVGKK